MSFGYTTLGWETTDLDYPRSRTTSSGTLLASPRTSRRNSHVSNRVPLLLIDCRLRVHIDINLVHQHHIFRGENRNVLPGRTARLKGSLERRNVDVPRERTAIPGPPHQPKSPPLRRAQRTKIRRIHLHKRRGV